MLEFDDSAKDHLPDQYEVRVDDYNLLRSRSSVRIAVSQLAEYMDAKYVEHPEERKTTPTLVGPVVNFLMMLPTYGLTIQWAVAASDVEFS